VDITENAHLFVDGFVVHESFPHILFTQYFIGYTKYQLMVISNVFVILYIMQITSGLVKKSHVKWTCQ